MDRLVPAPPRRRAVVLSTLQLRLAAIVRDLPEAEDFVLAGGGALVARGDVDRTTRDLDYFARSADQVPRLHAALERALEAAGLDVTTLRASEGFVRMVVADGTQATEIDLAHDYRLLPPEESAVGRTLAAEELAIDKVLALFDRAEARDFVDLAAVVDRWGLRHLCDRAKEKDAGFSAEILAGQLDRFDRLPRQDFDITDDALTRLRGVVRFWHLQLRELPGRETPGRGRGR
jgi:Nucleotidyl transferase AbiEii toxin, Type IV TA system